MRKKLLITAAVLVLLLLSFFVFLEYRQYSSYKIPIHQDADLIVKINADAFIRSFIKEYGINYRKKIESADKQDTAETGNTGIALAANIFIYNLRNRPATFFCTIPLTNETDFKKFLSKKTGMTFSTANEGNAYEGKLTIACSTEYAAIAWSGQKEEVKPVLSDLLNKRNLLPASDNLIQQLKKKRTHLVYASRAMGTGSVEIKGREILFHSATKLKDVINIPREALKRKMNESTLASFVLNYKPASSLFNKIYEAKGHTIETDSLLKYFNGYADITVTGFTEQKDTVTTYEFDENFEKKEVKTIRLVKVPEINMAIKASPGMLDYLQRQDIVTSSLQLNHDIFPLYQVTVQQVGPVLFFSTAGSPSLNPEFENAAGFAEYDIDLKKLQTVLDSTVVIKKYLAGVNHLRFTAECTTYPGISIDGSVRFEDSALKTLAELIKSRNAEQVTGVQ